MFLLFFIIYYEVLIVISDFNNNNEKIPPAKGLGNKQKTKNPDITFVLSLFTHQNLCQKNDSSCALQSHSHKHFFQQLSVV